MMEGWKYKSRAFKSYSFVTKKNKKEDRKFSSVLIQVFRGAYVPYFRTKAPSFCCSIFFKECFNPLAMFFLFLFLYFYFLYPSPQYFRNFFSNLRISPWLKKSFKVLRLIKKLFVSQKNWIYSFLLMPQVKFSPRLLSSSLQTEGNYLFPSNNVIWKTTFPKQKVGRIMELKKCPKLNLRKYCSQILMKFHHFCNIYVFGLFCWAII